MMDVMSTLIVIIEKIWGKFWSIPIFYIASYTLGVCICRLIGDEPFLAIPIQYLVIGLCIGVDIAYTVFCIKKYMLPCAPSKKPAVLFVIDTETSKSFKSVQYKLVKEFQDLVLANADSCNIIALCIPNKRVSKYDLSKKDHVETLLTKTKCLFLVSVKYLVDDDQNAENFEMRINFALTHPNFHETVERVLDKDLTDLENFVKQQSFAKESLLSTFRFTAQALSYTCQYIFGFVCFNCGEIPVAVKLYEDLLQQLINESPMSIVMLLKELVPVRLHVAYIAAAEMNMIHFQDTKDLSYLRIAKDRLEKAEKLISGSYAYNLNMAYIAIALDQNYVIAKSCIEQCKRYKNGTSSSNLWRYSDAFLSAYMGYSASSIIGKYETAFIVICPRMLDLTDYTEYILEKEPNRISLHLAAALLYERFGDYRLMKKHLTEYIDYLGDGNSRVISKLKKKMEDHPCNYDCSYECRKCSGQNFG